MGPAYNILMKKKLAFILLSLVFTQAAGAEPLSLMRRWAVFPFDAENSLHSASEDAWWKCREKITEKKKYLVASKQFLIQKDVFQPRKTLSPDDVKLLANLLEADVLITGFTERREFTLNAYLAQNGGLFWSKKMGFHPSLKATDQLAVVSLRLTQELLASIPYQAFTVVDPLIGKAVYEENGRKFVTVDMGITDDIGVGTDFQWIDFQLPDEKGSEPLLKNSKFSVIGEGKVVKIKRGVVVAELKRAKSVEAITEKTLVRLPSEIEKTEKMYLGTEVGAERLAPELLPTIINPVAPESTGAHRQTLVFGSILSILGILALAF